jgi:2-hydroxy-3-keto-5-methylthiopentenyl-1-phosphate phosphatase
MNNGTIEQVWRQVLDGCQHELVFFLDLDGTVWLPDILVGLNETFGPLDEHGQKVWKLWDRLYKVEHQISNREHLLREYRDVFGEVPLAQIIEWTRTHVHLRDGFMHFLSVLQKAGVSPVAISNGARQIGSPLLTHLGIDMPAIFNELVLDATDAFLGFQCLHGEDGIKKGDLVDQAAALGYCIVGCAGDSFGDIGMVESTLKHGGIALACESLAGWCWSCNHLQGACTPFSDFREALAAVSERISQIH